MHLTGWFQNTNPASLTAISRIAESIVVPAGGTTDIFVPAAAHNVMWAAALGTTLNRAKFNAPSIAAARSDYEITPRRRGGVAFSLLLPEIHRPYRPIPLAIGENLQVLVVDGAGAAEHIYALAELAPDQLPAAPDGYLIVSRATGTTTLTASGWTTVPITLDSPLPVGTYALIGFVPISAGCIAARAIIPTQQLRPGAPGLAAAEASAVDYSDVMTRLIQNYDMGHFVQNGLPQFEFLSDSADTAETVFMFLVKVG